jgi:hypothetical protein
LIPVDDFVTTRFIGKGVSRDLLVPVAYSWFSRDVIAAMLVSHEQNISH